MSFSRELTKLTIAYLNYRRRKGAWLRRQGEREERWRKKVEEYDRDLEQVTAYEEQIERVLSLHEKCGALQPWGSIQGSSPPEKPVIDDTNEKAAREELGNYKPSLWDKLFVRTESRLRQLQEAVESGKRKDQETWQIECLEYERTLSKWKRCHDIARVVLAEDSRAYREAIEEADPFRELKDFGVAVEIVAFDGLFVEVTLKLLRDNVIPSEEKRLLKSGKLSVKKMPNVRFFELHRSFVCGCMIRVAREIFAVLPVITVLVTVEGKPTQSEDFDLQAIASATIERLTLEKANLMHSNPTDIICTFVHSMNFKKTKGFYPLAKKKRS